MDDTEIRDRALSAATMISPMEGGQPQAVLERARVFENYLRGAPALPDAGEHFDLPMTQIATADVTRVRALVGADDGQSTLRAVERFTTMVQEQASQELAERVEDACGGLLIQLENAATTQPAIRAWIKDVQGAFRTRSPFPEAPPANAVSDAEVTEARQRLLEQLANFSSHRPALSEWLRAVGAALAKSEPWPMPDAVRPQRAEMYGHLLERLGLASTIDPRVTRWLADVRGALDRSNEPDTVDLPRLEPIDPFATAPVEPFTPELHVFGVKRPDAPPPPDDVNVLLAMNGARLIRSSWITTDTKDGSLWCWRDPETGEDGPAYPWHEAIADDRTFGIFPLRDVTTEDRQAAEQNDEPVAEVPRLAEGHDDPARSSKPERYEQRNMDIEDEGTREVLVCLDCVAELGESAGRGNVVDVVRHDSYHDERDREGVRP